MKITVIHKISIGEREIEKTAMFEGIDDDLSDSELPINNNFVRERITTITHGLLQGMFEGKKIDSVIKDLEGKQ